MRKFLAGVFIVTALFIVAANVYDGSNSRIAAAALTTFQIDSIIDLLRAFNIDESKIGEVRDALIRSSVSTTTPPEEVDPQEAGNETSQATTTESGVVEVSGPPSCALSSTHLTPLQYDSVTLSWESNNATHVEFSLETTGITNAKDLPLPEDELATEGSVTFTVGAEIKHQVYATAFGADDSSTCNIVIEVLDPITSGNYRGEINGELFAETAGVRRFDALENCKLKASDNPNASILCTWNSDVIYSTD